mmetsp:Transcript_62022/g.139742  ORF Transcript_62022/g.139742 Transcript_62022/m.139742 type:complete len:118 (+) Transcript_62022:79-432(+)|eukprot:CAMPEP_0197891920 /NCGR_PEP_ID=MMETSP1439-20131203/29872_1 /TAXON_ID=66791 /ORGANISM="Gonyaulax spinifera, Strain CCMP409" /LENGTH=117 /DNA_ID=CAMNT_0043512059 /DNA_START=70 /DNA_END=423 /DNA_ORIENTATION=-
MVHPPATEGIRPQTTDEAIMAAKRINSHRGNNKRTCDTVQAVVQTLLEYEKGDIAWKTPRRRSSGHESQGRIKSRDRSRSGVATPNTTGSDVMEKSHSLNSMNSDEQQGCIRFIVSL